MNMKRINKGHKHVYTDAWLKQAGRQWKEHLNEYHINSRKTVLFIDMFFCLGIKTCKRCGREYKWTGRAQKYCSDCKIPARKERYERNKPAPKIRIINCDMCGKEVVVTSSRQLRCVNCRKKHVTTYNREYMREYYPTHKEWWQNYWKKNHL